jgi:transcriptional regulator with XRE-family HTH domain
MADPHTSDVAANVRAEVARRRLRQAEIAEHLGLNQQQVSRRLNGQVAISASELQQFAQLLGVSVATLCGEPVSA